MDCKEKMTLHGDFCDHNSYYILILAITEGIKRKNRAVYTVSNSGFCCSHLSAARNITIL